MDKMSVSQCASVRKLSDSGFERLSIGSADNYVSTLMDDVRSHHSSNFEVSNLDENGNTRYYMRRDGGCSYRFQLEKDVEDLQQQLHEERELHATLKDAVEKNFVELSTPSHHPRHTIELLSSISALETTILELEEAIISLHYQLSQERNERRLAEYRLQRSYFDNTLSPSWKGNRSPPEPHPKPYEPVNYRNLTKDISFKGLWLHPNRLSEEMVRCMRSIFISLAESAPPSNLPIVDSPHSPHVSRSKTPLWSSEPLMTSMWAKSPNIDSPCDSEVLKMENDFDPYKASGKLSWIDIGRYGSAIEVSWMSVGKRQLDYAAGSLRRFRLLVEQLAKVNPIHMSGDEKLAFWINLYNALIMHAYLAYGVPRTESKFFSLIRKAAYTVGGHLFSAAVIEYVILKMKPPLYRPQIALLIPLHKVKASEEQKKFAIDCYEPNVSFALSSGMYSSPAVQVFTVKNVREELDEAQRDYIRASVGVSSKGKLLVPKMLHSFARNYVDDSKLAQWVSRYLPVDQAAFVDRHMSHKRHRLFGSRNCGVLPFDSRFRYLFLPDQVQK